MESKVRRLGHMGETPAGQPAAANGSAAAPPATPDSEHDQRWDRAEGLWNELSRSRRYGRSFVLMRVGGKRPGRRMRVRWPRRRPQSVDASVVKALFRRIDYIWPDGDGFVVLLTECGIGKVDGVVGRIRAALEEWMGDVEISIAAFPEHGLTSGALMAALDGGTPARARGVRGVEVGDRKTGAMSLVEDVAERLPTRGIVGPAEITGQSDASESVPG